MDHTSGQRRNARSLVSLGRNITEDQVIWTFLQSELESPRWNRRLVPHLSPALATKVQSDDYAAVSGYERTELRHAIVAHRGRFVESLLQPATKWTSVILDIKILPELRVVAEKDFVERAPSRLLGEFAAAADARASTIPDFDLPYSRIRASFDPRRLRGVPILVATDENGPYTIAEGLTRLTCLESLKREGRIKFESIDAVLGVNSSFATWNWL